MATTNPIVTAITGYVEEKRENLLTAAILGADSAKRFNLQSDVKGPTALNLLATDVVFGDGEACGWSESGSTEFSHRILTPKALKVNMAFCDKNLLKTWANYKVKVAAGQKDLPFEEEWVNSIVASVNEQVEKMIYQGSSANTEFGGLIEILTAEDDVVSADAASGVSAYDFIKGVAKAIPAAVKTPSILVSISMYREYMQDLVAANLYHYDPANGANEYALPGTDIKVIGVAGLEGTSYAIAADLEKNVFYGVSADGDEDKFELWYSQDNREFRLAIEFIAGVQVAFPSEVVLGKRG